MPSIGFISTTMGTILNATSINSTTVTPTVVFSHAAIGEFKVTTSPFFPPQISVWLIVVVALVSLVFCMTCACLVMCVCCKKGSFHIYREQSRIKKYKRMAEEIRDITTEHPPENMSYGTLPKTPSKT